MPGGMTTSGTEELSEMLGQLGAQAESIASAALYEGAGVVADAYTQAVRSIRAEPFRRGTTERPRYASPEEKAALQNVTGISRFRSDGGAEINTIIGAARGYANIGGKPKAVRLIANAINSGTSFMVKQPVFRKAASSSRKAAQAAMEKAAEELINQITK